MEMTIKNKKEITMTINQSISKAERILLENKIEEAPLKARLLLAYMLGVKKERLITRLEEELPQTTEENYINEIYRIAKGYPLEYIIRQKGIHEIRNTSY